jgi:tetratricopeptide (TPR) repeat protein
MKSLLFCLLTLLCVKIDSIAQNRKIDSLQTLLKTAKDDTSKVKAMDLISEYNEDKSPDTGLAVGERALRLSETINWKPGMARSYTCIGRNYVFLSDSANALLNYRKALEIYGQIGDKSGTAWITYYTGSVYLYQLSDYQKALTYLEQSMKLFEQLQEKKGMASSLDKIGLVYETLGDNSRALNSYQRAERLDEEIGNKLGIANCDNNMGLLYDDLTEYPKALEYCQKALNLFDSLGSKQGVAAALGTIGQIYLNSSKYDEALKYLQKAEKMEVQMGQSLGIAQLANYEGMVNARLFNYGEAIQSYRKAFNLYKQLGYKSGMAVVLDDIGYVYESSPDSFMNKLGYRGKGRYKIAAETLKQSLKLSVETGDFNAQRRALEDLSSIYAKQGDFFNAYETHKKFVVVNDSIYNDEKQKQITHREIEYEYSKKEELLKAEQDKKNALAAAEISRQKIIRNYTIAGVAIVAVFAFFMIVAYNKRKKARFETQVAEVEMQAMRLQMNPHFIFNCMHSINKYVIDNEKHLASEFLIRFSKLMRLILENSREKLISVKSDLLTLELYMQLEALRFKHKFDYSISVDPAIDTEKTLIPPMLLQPFVENSIVHGIQNRAGGLIKINISKEGEMIRCTVEDNGIGRKQAAIFKSTTETKKESLGVKITQERLQIISQLKKVKTGIFMEDLTGTASGHSGLRVDLLLPLETEF